MNRKTYRPRKPTTSQKRAAMDFQGTDDFNRVWADMKNEFAEREREQEERAFLSDPDIQAAIEEDSRRAMAIATGRSDRYVVPTPATEPEFKLTPTPVPTYHTIDDPDRRLLKEIRPFVFGGNAVFTVVSKVSGSRFTFKVQASDDGRVHFVKVLTGPDNESSYTYLGTIFADGAYRHGKKSSVGYDAPSAKVARWFFTHLDDAVAMAKCEVWHEGRCCRCGRRLTVPASIEAGIGPECAQRVQ